MYSYRRLRTLINVQSVPVAQNNCNEPVGSVDFGEHVNYNGSASEHFTPGLRVKKSSTMTIRCPRCGQTGNIPAQRELTVDTIRCRKCMTRFSRASVSDLEGLSRWRPGQVPPRPAVPVAAVFAAVPVHAHRADERRIDSAASVVSARDDSQYEMPVVTDPEDDDSHWELPAVEPDQPSSDDEFPAYVEVRPDEENAIASPWYLNLIDYWARYHFGVALVFGALSIVVLGFALFRAVSDVGSVSLSITSLVIGSVALVAFAILLVSSTALNLVLVDLARNVRRLRMPSDRDTRVASQ